MRIAGGVFTFRLVPTLITLFLLAVLVGLGTWQVQRAAWKENLLATMGTRRLEAPINLTTTKTINTDLNYRSAIAEGRFAHDKTLYLQAISQTGEGGYNILTPLKLHDGQWLLVNRGFVPYDKKQAAALPKNKIRIVGVLRSPAKPGWMRPANQPATNVWYSLDLSAMAKAAGIPTFMPYVLEAAASPQAGVYPIGGQTRFELPNNHAGYALTWYSLAIVLLVVYGVSGWKPGNKKK